MSRTPAEPITTEAGTAQPATEPRPRATRAALRGALAATVAGLAATGTVVALAVRAG
ncbi:hypothetical protein [Cellulosimicrobium cellulans]|uniref:hypothetical protein n=1 Tax=Cellulosimicrobium cellulans TaxID=1710 RepID=UPI001651C95B|nr:hypothetical protein [Cellulosimicrobium cellulans]